MPARLESVRNHWWWRPGWRVGRHLYACHLTLDDQPELRELIDHYQGALAHLETLDLIPPGSLYLTMQRIGWADEVSPAELEVVAERIERVAKVIGDPTRVIAGTDCGFDTSAGAGRVADDIVWAKLAALSEPELSTALAMAWRHGAAKAKRR